MNTTVVSSKPPIFLVVIATVFLSGCSLAPSPGKISGPGENRTTFRGNKARMDFHSTAWWKAFQDDKLTRQVEDVLKNAPDAKAILARLAAFREQAKIAGAPLLPSINLDANASRSKTNLGTFLPQGGSFTNNSFGLQLSASYEFDLWGKLSNTAKTAKLSLLEAEENRDVVFQTLAANTVELYTELSQARREVKLRAEAVAAAKELEKSMKTGYVNGTIQSTTYLTAIQQLKSGKQALSTTETRVAALEASLNALAGRDIGAIIPVTDFSSLPTKATPIPSGLPSELLNRRPDVRTVRLKVENALLQVGIARAALLPTISLTAQKGYKSNELSQLVDSGSSVWSLMGGIVQPLFNRGAKRAAVRQAHHNVEAAIADYRKTALNAFKEVDIALTNFADAGTRLELETESIASETIKVKQARTSYLSGTTGIQPYLSAQIAYLNQLVARDQVALSMMQTRVRLATALGDGLNVYQTISGELR